MQASKELWELILLLVKTNKESFEEGLVAWHTKWSPFLNERKIDFNSMLIFLISVFRSLYTNLPWLFT